MNHLARIDDFRAALANYQLSDAALQTLAAAPLVLLVGPTGSGRNTIIEELVKTGSYHYIVSDTTREPRRKGGVPIEQNGREYWFRSEDEVLDGLRRGEYVEAAIIHEQQVSGISVREVQKANEAHKIAIKEIEPQGLATIRRLKPNVTIIFVLPPNFDEWMRRLRGRSDLPEDEVRRRLTTADQEIATALAANFCIFVVNDELARVVADVDAIARMHQQNPERQQTLRQLAQQLHADLAAYLKLA